MALILFNKRTSFQPLIETYRYEAGVTYEVPEWAKVKFCSQMGVAVEVSEEDAVDVQPDPAAELAARKESALKPTEPEAAPEVPEDRGGNPLDTDETAAPRYALKGRGGPWFILIDTSTGKELPGKPMRKRDAEKMIDELANQDIQSTDG